MQRAQEIQRPPPPEVAASSYHVKQAQASLLAQYSQLTGGGGFELYGLPGAPTIFSEEARQLRPAAAAASTPTPS